MGNSSRPKWTISKHSKQTWNEIVDEVEDHFVESLEQWRQKVGIKKMTLFGHSLGGYFAACYALKYPEKVEKLILVSPAGIPENTPEERVNNSDTTTLHERLEEEANQIGAYYQAEAAAAENAAKMQQQQEQVQRLEGSSSNSSSQNDNSTTLSPPQRRKIPAWATYLWDRNITPMSIIRMIGPFGPSLVHTYTSRRFAHLETAEQHDLYDYM
ncbi:Alpha/Beta hydrolase protein [Mycotypha africana]|uniref:Alpha/Beta hydrolase protein n=1 Tax=Mycotypha africana TaxID=64632 RepID=UPI002301B80B|nr:Alpha/Beta hydrolase protein [Mycotypha africana]KAI8991675.1 Alpha/Beta hydrolase protein [Mycotypha africana]